MDFRISNYQNLITNLLLSGHFIQMPGLMHGKIGIAIQFYHLSRKTGNTAFETFAGELIDDIISDLSNKQLSPDFENGLTGIGWGIEYLIQNHFLDADSDEVLEEFDKQIFQSFLEDTMGNISLLNGLLGTGHYFLMRLKSSKQKGKNVIVETNRFALQQICDRLNPMLSDLVDLLKEPTIQDPARINETNCKGLEPVPVFEITWNLPVLIGFLAEIAELNFPSTNANLLLVRILTLLNLVPDFPVLQSNRLLLLASLQEIMLKPQLEASSEWNEILVLANRMIEKITGGYDHAKYLQELNRLNFSIGNGKAGLAQVQWRLYEQTNNHKFLEEYSNLLGNIMQDKYITQFWFDYSDPNKTNELELGVLHGISGMLLTALTTEMKS